MRLSAESRMKSTEATVFDRKSGGSRATVCSVKRVRVGLVVEKTWTGSTWETRLRFPLSPNAAAAGFLRKQNSSRWRLSELLQHVASFGVESHQEFMSQGDANHFLGFAGRRYTLAEGAEVSVMTADPSSHDEENFPDGASSSTYAAFAFPLTA